MDLILSILRILQVAFGIGLVIFVHEAGHYIAARACGVRVEVFSLGFGPRLWAWRRGPTTYQLALVPFGGYVRMAGEEQMSGGERDRDPQPYELGAKSPLQRILIFSGGVVMNALFALVVLPMTLFVGVPTLSPVIGDPAPGSPAWHARLEGGSTFYTVNANPLHEFNDIPNEIALSGADPVTIEYSRPGSSLRETITIQPTYASEDGIYRIGVPQGFDPERRLVVAEGGAAEAAGLATGDRLIGVVGLPASLSPVRQLLHAIASEQPIRLRVERDGTELELEIEPRLTTVEERSLLGFQPADLLIRDVRASAVTEALGVRPGDRLRRIGDSRPNARDQVLEALLHAPAGTALVVQRDGKELELPLPELDEAGRVALDSDLAIELDMASARVAVLPRSAAEEAGMRTGDRIVRYEGEAIDSYEVFLTKSERARKDGRRVRLDVERIPPEGEMQYLTFEIEPRPVAFQNYGLSIEPANHLWRVPSATGAIAAGFSSSVRLARTVWLTLRKMGSGEVSSKNMGGIITIGLASHSVALEGWSKLFFFLCMLSINLAFLNVLPIPVLDGGHLFFLFVEMIKGSPVSERTLGYSQVVGLVLIVSLMVYVTYNDVMRYFFRG